ncbi:excalibur calcium-binding domain-containing protein [Pseudonocardia sediminis]|uniref:Excalibur calcium-binding domain-containing protein n=1 Tax=Pseudonocardia sediminis TaxID=1397368 RepID=A0A4Q7UPQ0_PSEST|nr:excalibur calcium-binding domain-containing protein [Pseudonocardia sediminis]RZT83585.1 excalibur calcium-binding domain-containing protein [Pseudonocardia sediminis]
MTTTQWQTTGTAFPAPSPEPRPTNGRATAGFVLSIVGLVVGWLPIVGLLVVGPALGLSISGFLRSRDGRAATAGRSVAGIVMSVIGAVICVAMTVAVVNAAPVAPAPVAAPAPVVAPAPVLLPVPNVVGSGDVAARDILLRAGFTNVTLGPSTGSIAGVAAGTVTTQLPLAGAQASAGDPIVLGEASAPPLVAAPEPVVAPQSAPVTQEPAAVVDEPSADVDTRRPFVAAPRAASVPQSSLSGSSSSGGSAYYANCSAARAAGAAPLSTGDPGYSSKLDRDGDGIACE